MDRLKGNSPTFAAEIAQDARAQAKNGPRIAQDTRFGIFAVLGRDAPGAQSRQRIPVSPREAPWRD